MTMKKLLLLTAAMAAMHFTAGAQPLEWGVHAGLNLAWERASATGGAVTTNSQPQFQAGFTLSTRVARAVPLYFRTGLDFTGRGGESDGATDNLYYLQLPLTLSCRIDCGRIVSIRPEVGFYYALGLFANAKEEGVVLEYEGRRFDYFNTKVEGRKALKRSDLGLRFGVDAVLKRHYGIGIGYDQGLLNINKNLYESDVKLRNGVFYIRLSYDL